MHYKRDREKIYIDEQYERKKKQLKQYSETNQLRWAKAIAETAKIIVKKNTKILSNKDYEEVAKVLYGKCTKLNTLSTKRKMNSEIAKQQINTELVSLYNKANLSKERLPELYAKIESYADEKKDGNLLFKLTEKIEKVNNLEQKAEIKAHETREFSSFSSLKDNKPDKITQTITQDDKTLKLIVKNEEKEKSTDPSE
jgi:hypothetical protein